MRFWSANLHKQLVTWLGNGMIAAGALLLLATGGIYAYAQYEQAQAQREAAALVPDVPTAWTPIAVPTTVPSPTAAPTFTASPVPLVAVPTSIPTATDVPPTATPIPMATPVPTYPAIRIVATAIDLDSKIVESPIENGEWQVPKFYAGHLVGTAQPLQGSNVVLSGHVQSISSGNVFARIGELKVGDVIRLYTQATVITYVVSKSIVVANTDLSVVQPTSQEQVTLITCTGTWLPLQHDYNQRIVVIATK